MNNKAIRILKKGLIYFNKPILNHPTTTDFTASQLTFRFTCTLNTSVKNKQ